MNQSNGNIRTNSRRSVSMNMSFYEPVAANVAIFVALITLDIFNKATSLIPVHAIAGVLITFITLYLCRSNYLTAAWVFAIIPALFLLVTFLTVASKNKYVIGAGNTINKAYKGTVDTASRGFNTVYNTVDYLYDEGKEFVDDINQSGMKLTESASNTWMRLFNQNKKDGLSDGQAALAATASSGVVPPAGSDGAKIVEKVSTQVKNTIINREYLYLCGDGTEDNPPSAQLAKNCKEISEFCAKSTDPSCKDNAISILQVHAVCLGSLATRSKDNTSTSLPSSVARDQCLDCEMNWKEKYTSIDQCRCTAMGNCPEETTVVTGFSNYGSPYFPA